MNRAEFIRQLETLLQNISQGEREEALQYYNDYFDDAGPENEQDVIDALGNPARVAENIKRDLFSGGYGDNAYQQTMPNDKAVVPYGNAEQNKSSQTSGGSQAQIGSQTMAGNSNKLSTGMIVIIAVLCILASPLIMSILTGVLGALIGLVVTWFSLILAFGSVALALLIVFFILAGLGVAALFTEPLVSVALLGGGMLCGGIGILFMMLTVAMAGIATPAICREIVKLFKKVVHK